MQQGDREAAPAKDRPQLTKPNYYLPTYDYNNSNPDPVIPHRP